MGDVHRQFGFFDSVRYRHRIVGEPNHFVRALDAEGHGIVGAQLRRLSDRNLGESLKLHHLPPSFIPWRRVSGPPVQTGAPCIGSPLPQVAASNSMWLLLAFTLPHNFGVVISSTGPFTRPFTSPLS